MEDGILNPAVWLAIGILGQVLFLGRFLVQWIYSEIHRRSVVPVYFWYFSLAGGAVLLVYAIHIGDPVFGFGQGLALLIYVRNLLLIRASRKKGDAIDP